MANAAEVVQKIRSDLSAIDEEIRRHPYLDAIQAGTVPKEALRSFAGHQYHIVTSDLRSIAFIIQRFGHPPCRDFFIEVLRGELAAIGRIVTMAQRLGMTEKELESYEVSPGGFAYATFMAWQSAYASAAEFTCGILVNFDAWGFNCGCMSKALRETYGFSSEETAFLDGFADLPPFEEEAIEIIQHGLDNGVEPKAIHRGARLFQGYEKMFWDTMAQVAGVKMV
ncbi:MAG: hypothetical protein PVF76_16785 [Syntrophobacterales bacterium]|jgi:hypothetical protein